MLIDRPPKLFLRKILIIGLAVLGVLGLLVSIMLSVFWEEAVVWTYGMIYAIWK